MIGHTREMLILTPIHDSSIIRLTAYTVKQLAPKLLVYKLLYYTLYFIGQVHTDSMNPLNLYTFPSLDITFTSYPLATRIHSVTSISLCLT